MIVFSSKPSFPAAPDTPLECLKESRGGRAKINRVLDEIVHGSTGERHELAEEVVN